MDERTASAIEWLLGSREPAVRYLTRRDLLGGAGRDDRERILEGPWVRALLAGQHADGGFGQHPYGKWTGAHWRLVSLVELAVPAGHPPAMRALETVFDWLTARERLSRILPKEDGRTYRCASQEGNALAVACRLGAAGDDRARLLAEVLVRWQWPDGGWNCSAGSISSFHETHAPMWGLHEYAAVTGDRAAVATARKAAEPFLTRRLFRSLRTGEVINQQWLALHYPPYWHYDVLQGLLVLSRMGLVGDPRASEALDHLEKRRLPDGRWRAGAYWWRPAKPGGAAQEVVDWGRSGPNQMITLNALRVLRAAGRL